MANMKKLCFTAFDNGITHFDLANNYSPEPGSTGGTGKNRRDLHFIKRQKYFLSND